MFVSKNAEGKTVVEVDAFIVPNCHTRFENREYENSYSLYRVVKYWSNFNTPIDKKDLVSLSWTASEPESDKEYDRAGNAIIPAAWIDMWLVDRDRRERGEDSNVVDHGELNKLVPELVFWDKDGYRYSKLYGFFPAAYFAGKKEGDVVEFEFCHVLFKFRLNQTSYRYARFGKFEDAYNYVLK